MPARVSALRERPGGRVDVELDGARWRTMPVEVVVRAGLVVGAEVDRERARTVARELRRARALGVATRSLRVRDRSSHELAARLEQAGVGEDAGREALRTLARSGLVDDERFAAARAAALATREYGDAAIRDDLERRGIAAELVDDAIAALEPESERAAAVVERRGAGRATAARLARRGFGEDAVELGLGGGDDPG